MKKKMQAEWARFSKKVGGVVVVTMVLLGGVVGYYHFSASSASSVRIGVVLAGNVYAHGKAFEGFMRKHDQLEKKKRYLIEPFYFEGDDPASLARAVDALERWRPDIVVVQGYFATPFVASRVKRVPVVFIGVDDCVERGLVASLEHPGGHITGVIAGEYDRLAMAAMLQVIKPGARHVLVPYDLYDDVGGLVEKDAQAVKRMLARYLIEVTILPLEDMAHAVEEIAAHLTDHDVLMTLECDPLENLIPRLVPLCEETATTFFPGSLGGMDAGAAIAFGGHAQVPGKAAFDLVHSIAEAGIEPADLPVVAVTGNRQLVINAYKAARQHLQPVNEEAIRLRMLRYNSSQPFLPNLKIVTGAR